MPESRPWPWTVVECTVGGTGARTAYTIMAPSRKVNFDTVRRIALEFPGVEEGVSYGTAAFRVKGKFLSRLREDGETLVVKCGFDERDFRMQADPETFFNTDHYRGYPTVLIRLNRVSPKALREVFEQAWLRSAPRRLVGEYRGRRKAGGR